MTTAAIATVSPISAGTLEKVLLDGNLAGLNSNQRIEYMTRVCESLGLNPLTKPFEFLTFQGKMVMYARRDCTEQLRKIHGVSVTIAARETTEGCYVVTARAQDASGRHDESIGAVSIEGLKGEARSNAMMKAETKAKRRVTLSVCGLGILDESEAESIPGARQATPDYTPPAKESATAAPKASASNAGAPSSREGTSTVDARPNTTLGVSPSAAATSAKPLRPNGVPMTAADIVPTGGAILPGQLATIRSLLASLGTVTDDAYRKGVAVYRQADGSRCVAAAHEDPAALLSKDQAAHLIARFQEKNQRQESRANRGVDLGAVVAPETAPTARMPATRNLDDEFQRAFENDESEREWVHGLFGVESVKDLDRGQQETALSLILAWNTPLWDETEQKARALGRIR